MSTQMKTELPNDREHTRTGMSEESLTRAFLDNSDNFFVKKTWFGKKSKTYIKTSALQQAGLATTAFAVPAEPTIEWARHATRLAPANVPPAGLTPRPRPRRVGGCAVWPSPS